MKLKFLTALVAIFSALTASADWNLVEHPHNWDFDGYQLNDTEDFHDFGHEFRCVAQFGDDEHYSAAGHCNDREQIESLQERAVQECKSHHRFRQGRCRSKGCHLH